jgi:hypothetical protein
MAVNVESHEAPEGRADLAAAWVAFMIGPSAWALNQLAGYALIKPICSGGSAYVLVALSGMALAATLGGIWLAFRVRVADGSGASAPLHARTRTVALWAIWLNALLALLIVTAAVPPLLLSPCE